MATIIDIDNTLTAVVPRLDKNAPPIILYTLKPPPYSEHMLHELIQKSEHYCADDDKYTEHGQTSSTVVENDDDDELTPCEQCVQCIGICGLFVFVFMIVFGIVFISCSCF